MAKKKRRTLSEVASEQQEVPTGPKVDAGARDSSATTEAVRTVQRRQASSEEPEPEPKPKRLNVNLHPELYARFKHRCHQEDRPISDVVRDLVEAYLSV